MSKTIIKAATVVNEGQTNVFDVLLSGGRIEKIAPEINTPANVEIDAEGLHLLPGLIDDQVHFREPGLTHKADIWHESRAAVAGGITSFMEMPNTVPNTLTQELLQDKYDIASSRSLANYSFYMGAANDNLDEVLRTDPHRVCGVKVFMGSSTGNMLVDDEYTLEGIFANSPLLIATHCEDERTIRQNLAMYTGMHGEDGLTIDMHPLIRSAEACYISSSRAVDLARKHGTRLHVLHISTTEETGLFENNTPLPLAEKRITAEACVHHLWFTDADYAQKGNLIKWNPAVKTAADRKGILEAVLDGRIDIIATDHAPHTLAEKLQPYAKAPSGGPLVQHALLALLDMHHDGRLTLEQLVEKTAHHVATCFQVEQRGFIREGYWADLVLVDLNKPYTVSRDNILSKCGWSPFEGHTFKSTVTHTWVSGNLAYKQGKIVEQGSGQRLSFQRL
ncbi:dihydroorotase [Parapedobacter soli]|uniref:dihydroorotase n=1 Tax=Parapedobacter soli TaxID=416955 RepID=UPI0021C660D6|nr:dihydroorotase [Parapedobacter soli]